MLSGGVRTLLIDNYDSFTYNLAQLLAEVSGEEPIVVRNDELSWPGLAARGGFDNVVISPGPGRPERPADFGVCGEVIRECELPLLGVCLGHQGICSAYGAAVVHAPEPMHGRTSAVLHDGRGPLAGLPRELRVVRYHSLCVELPLPAELEGIAWSSDGVLMAVEHRTRPQWGLQFHPESVCSEHGRAIVENFYELTAADAPPRSSLVRPHEPWLSFVTPAVTKDNHAAVGESPGLELRRRRLDFAVDTERTFADLYRDREVAFWLDSSRLGGGARFSFMGDDSGPLAAVVSHEVGAGESIFERLADELRRRGPVEHELPFELDCGFVGYLGYELKAETGGDAAHASPLPDAFFVFADRLVAVDHGEGATYLLALCPRGEAEAAAVADAWLEATERRLRALPPLAEPATPAAGADGPAGASPAFELARSEQRYLAEIAACQAKLRDGESYEICLTNAVEAELDADPFELYRRLRRANPAPFAAYLRCGEAAVLSSSPERFLAVGADGWAEAKPIKGTAPRGDSPAADVGLAERLREDEKNRAENLMICDLLRNDLGRVCEVGTVHVPALMQVESYETVHQLVSTVRGLLRQDLTAPEAARACFPPGSMTGAPKRRTMAILDQLEGAPRGVYSGAIGWFGLSGACDLSVVIRTIVLAGGRARVGSGGAIVTQSDPEAELGEMLLKAAAPLRAIDPGADLARARRSGDPASGTRRSG